MQDANSVTSELTPFHQHFLFMVSLSIALLCATWQLEQFPIYFFSDEAALVNLGRRWILGEHQDHNITSLLYYQVEQHRWIPMMASYLVGLSSVLFGKSIEVARLTCSLLSMLGVVALSYSLRLFFKCSCWWITPLLFFCVPTWFLHSRTAFDTSMSASFVMLFICCYLLVRVKFPNLLYFLPIIGALAFYTYSANQVIIPALALLLLISDSPFFLRNLRQFIVVLILSAVLLTPVIKLHAGGSAGLFGQLNVFNSDLVLSAPLQDRLLALTHKYLAVFDKHYWLDSPSKELIRHRVGSHALFPYYLVPFVLLGFVTALWRWRSPQYRVLLIALACVPIPSAITQLGITRVMSLIPLTIALACIGLDQVLRLLPIKRLISVASLLIVEFLAVGMLAEAIYLGPLWFRDYSFYGLQYGAKQIYQEAIPQILRADRDAKLIVSPNWANTSDQFFDFFLNEEQKERVQIAGISGYLTYKTPIDENLIFVLPREEYEQVISSGKFQTPSVNQLLYFPDGSIGFYFVRLQYVANVDEIFEMEAEQRRRPVEEKVKINGRNAIVRHSLLDMGSAAEMFDAKVGTVARGMEANPFLIEIEFESARTLTKLWGDFGCFAYRWEVELTRESGQRSKFIQEYNTSGRQDSSTAFEFPEVQENVKLLRMQISNINNPGRDNIHVFDLRLQE